MFAAYTLRSGAGIDGMSAGVPWTCSTSAPSAANSGCRYLPET